MLSTGFHGAYCIKVWCVQHGECWARHVHSLRVHPCTEIVYDSAPKYLYRDYCILYAYTDPYTLNPCRTLIDPLKDPLWYPYKNPI